MIIIPEGATHVLDNFNYLMFVNGVEHAYYEGYGWSTCEGSKTLDQWMENHSHRLTEVTPSSPKA